MIKTLTSALLATILAAAPAFAQNKSAPSSTQSGASSGQSGTSSSQSGNQSGTSAGSGSNQSGGSAQSDGMNKSSGQQASGQPKGAMSDEQMAASQQKVMKSLTDAGLQDVTIVDAAYLVQARTSDDEQVMMVVNSAGVPLGQGGNQTGSSGGNQGTSKPN